MPDQRFCMRCAKPAVRGDSATEEIWRCPTQHGVIYRAPLSNAQRAEPEMIELEITQTNSKPEPRDETPEEEAEREKLEEEQEEDREERGRAPAPPAARVAPKKK